MGEALQQVHHGVASRTPADVSTLLVELGRALRSCQFYPEGHPAKAELLDRCWRAWRAELDRGGPLELEVRRGLFWLAGTDVAVGRGRLEELARDCTTRAVRRLRLDPELDAPSFRALLDVLSADREALAEQGGVERVLYKEERRGIQLNELDYAAVLARAGGPEPASGPQPGSGADGEPQENGGPPRGGEEPEDETQVLEAAGQPIDPNAAASAPLAPPPSRARREDADLVALLRELDTCEADERYVELARRAVEMASRLAGEGFADEGYRAALVLSGHAAGEGGRSRAQSAAARDALGSLATGVVLDDLIRRACAQGPDASLRATRILLQLGSDAAPALLAALETEGAVDRRGQLAGILIAMGDSAAPEFLRAIESGEPHRVRVAVRMAGESQNPRAVASLRSLLHGKDSGLRREAAKALVRIGDGTAFDALVEALGSPRSDVPELAAFCLGASGRAAAVPPLVDTVRTSLRTGRLGLAREAIRSLGRLGRPEAAPVLTEILGRRSFFRRRRLRELKVTAAAALARVPGEPARSALARAAKSRDSRLRQTAAGALERQATDASCA